MIYRTLNTPEKLPADEIEQGITIDFGSSMDIPHRVFMKLDFDRMMVGIISKGFWPIQQAADPSLVAMQFNIHPDHAANLVSFVNLQFSTPTNLPVRSGDLTGRQGG